MNRDEDREIRNVFDRLRREEERTAPEFHSVLEAENSRHRAAGWELWRRPAIVLLLLFLAAGPGLYFSFRDTGIRESEIPFELESWESPTDFLLTFTDSSLDSEAPEIGTTLWEEDDLTNLEN